MGWIVFTILFILLAAALLVVSFLKFEDARGKAMPGVQWGLRAASVGILLFTMFLAFISSVHTVPAGHVGVQYEFGAINGQTSDGFQLIPPWQSLKNASIQVQSFAFTNNPDNVPDNVEILGEGLDSFSLETQDVFINARLDIKVSPRDIQSLYREVGDDYVAQIVPQRVAQLFKNETVKYSTVEIAPNREIIRAAVEEALDEELDQFSIDVVAVLIDNITFDPDFIDAIESKQIAAQDAERAKELVKKAEQEALAKIALAEGTAGALIAEATGQSEANRLLSASLTADIIQFKALELAFGPGSPLEVVILPAGEGLIIDPTTLLTQAASAE